jgi:hypothetical protein
MLWEFANAVTAKIYRNDDKPMYRRGNKILIGICVYNIALFVFGKFFYVWRNK